MSVNNNLDESQMTLTLLLILLPLSITLVAIAIIIFKTYPREELYCYTPHYSEMLKLYVDICKQAITISSGTILLIVGATEKLFQDPQHPEFLVLSIMLFSIAITLLTIYLITATRSYEIAYRLSTIDIDYRFQRILERLSDNYQKMQVEISEQELLDEAQQYAEPEEGERGTSRATMIRNIILPSYAFTLFAFGYISVAAFFYFQFF